MDHHLGTSDLKRKRESEGDDDAGADDIFLNQIIDDSIKTNRHYRSERYADREQERRDFWTAAMLRKPITGLNANIETLDRFVERAKSFKVPTLKKLARDLVTLETGSTTGWYDLKESSWKRLKQLKLARSEPFMNYEIREAASDKPFTKDHQDFINDFHNYY